MYKSLTSGGYRQLISSTSKIKAAYGGICAPAP